MLETLRGAWLEFLPEIKLGEKFVGLVAIKDVKGGRNGLHAEMTPLECSSDGLILETKPYTRAKGNPEQYKGLFKFHTIVAEGTYETPE